MTGSPDPLLVALNGWYAGRAVGSGRYLDELAGALEAQARPGDAFDLVRPSRSRSNAYKVLFEQVEFPWRARSAHVAHVPYWAPPALPLTPSVVTIHDLIPLVLPEYRTGPQHRAYVRLVERATDRAAAVIADSEHTARDIRALLGVPDEIVHVVPLGVDRRFSPFPAANRLSLPERFGLYLGGFDRRKNLEVLLAAWRSVHEATGLPLALAGAPPDAASSTKLHPTDIASRVGLPPDALVLLGHVPTSDLPELYRRAAVFAYPSLYEGFGLPPLEAMACGTPTVVAAATSLPEVVGDAAALVEPHDEVAWADALRRIVEDEARSAALSAAGLNRAKVFDWARTAAMTRAVYESVRRN
ncbi:MAG: glycosyltransferase family 4 protein [Anaerolineae bacterium]